MNFIIIDDERPAADFVASLVKIHGHAAEVHYGRAQAIRSFSAKPSYYHGAIIDVFLDPGLGTDLIEEFREMRPDLPCLLISGITDPFNIERLSRHGLHLGKPFFPPGFTTVFRELVGLAEQNQPKTA